MTEKEIMVLAFNQGYELQKSNPDLAIQIAHSFSDPSIPYANGFISGCIEFIKEIGQEESIYRSQIDNLKTNNNERNQNRI